MEGRNTVPRGRGPVERHSLFQNPCTVTSLSRTRNSLMGILLQSVSRPSVISVYCDVFPCCGQLEYVNCEKLYSTYCDVFVCCGHSGFHNWHTLLPWRGVCQVEYDSCEKLHSVHKCVLWRACVLWSVGVWQMWKTLLHVLWRAWVLWSLGFSQLTYSFTLTCYNYREYGSCEKLDFRSRCEWTFRHFGFS